MGIDFIVTTSIPYWLIYLSLTLTVWQLQPRRMFCNRSFPHFRSSSRSDMSSKGCRISFIYRKWSWSESESHYLENRLFTVVNSENDSEAEQWRGWCSKEGNKMPFRTTNWWLKNIFFSEKVYHFLQWFEMDCAVCVVLRFEMNDSLF